MKIGKISSGCIDGSTSFKSLYIIKGNSEQIKNLKSNRPKGVIYCDFIPQESEQQKYCAILAADTKEDIKTLKKFKREMKNNYGKLNKDFPYDSFLQESAKCMGNGDVEGAIDSISAFYELKAVLAKSILAKALGGKDKLKRVKSVDAGDFFLNKTV